MPSPRGAPLRKVPQYPFQVSPGWRRPICRADDRDRTFRAIETVHEVVALVAGFNRANDKLSESADHDRLLAP
jgi:hypothetical protein